jgi:hypothetical protein
MRRTFLLAAIVYPLAAVLAFAQPPDASDKMPVIAESGGVEIDSIKIVREKASGAAKGADLTFMELDLWFAGDVSKESGGYVVHVTELDAILDDAGTDLSPESRRRFLDVLKAPVPVRESQITRGKAGPVVNLKLDAPARNVLRLKSIKGKATVSQSAVERLQFQDLAGMQGKSLEHASLADFPVKATVQVEDGKTLVKLEVPTPHERLVTWGLVKKNRMLSADMESVGLEGDMTILTASYEGDLVENHSLGLMLTMPNASREFEFNFEDVELP